MNSLKTREAYLTVEITKDLKKNTRKLLNAYKKGFEKARRARPYTTQEYQVIETATKILEKEIGKLLDFYIKRVEKLQYMLERTLKRGLNGAGEA